MRLAPSVARWATSLNLVKQSTFHILFRNHRTLSSQMIRRRRLMIRLRILMPSDRLFTPAPPLAAPPGLICILLMLWRSWLLHHAYTCISHIPLKSIFNGNIWMSGGYICSKSCSCCSFFKIRIAYFQNCIRWLDLCYLSFSWKMNARTLDTDSNCLKKIKYL